MSETKLCECGCGQPAPIATETRRKQGHVKGEPMRFVLGHAVRGRNLPVRNGGLCFDKQAGRWQIMCRDGSKAYFYRAVMEAELGRHLHPGEEVHHINGDPSDDRIENLELLSRAEHSKRHRVAVCKRGHEYTPENTYTTPTGARQCRACQRIRRLAV